MEVGLIATATYAAPVQNFPNGCHVCELEIDPDTGAVEITRYSVVDDVGTVINPLLLKGQIVGGVAQGVGQILMEDIHFDDDGQLVTGSFMDYAMPRATDISAVEVKSNPVPTETNPLGVKGAGEAGCVGAMPAVANALVDALSHLGDPAHRDAGDARAGVADDSSEREWRVTLLPHQMKELLPMKKSFVRGTWQVKRAFSPAVITEGAARIIWVAGHTGQVDDAGKSLAGDFDAQFQQMLPQHREDARRSRRHTRRHGDDDGVSHRRALYHPHDRAARRSCSARIFRPAPRSRCRGSRSPR